MTMTSATSCFVCGRIGFSTCLVCWPEYLSVDSKKLGSDRYLCLPTHVTAHTSMSKYIKQNTHVSTGTIDTDHIPTTKPYCTMPQNTRWHETPLSKIFTTRAIIIRHHRHSLQTTPNTRSWIHYNGIVQHCTFTGNSHLWLITWCCSFLHGICEELLRQRSVYTETVLIKSAYTCAILII